MRNVFIAPSLAIPRVWVLEESSACHDVRLPTAAHGEIKRRCVTQPDELQSLLLDRLGIAQPKAPAHRRDGTADRPHRLISR